MSCRVPGLTESVVLLHRQMWNVAGTVITTHFPCQTIRIIGKAEGGLSCVGLLVSPVDQWIGVQPAAVFLTGKQQMQVGMNTLAPSLRAGHQSLGILMPAHAFSHAAQCPVLEHPLHGEARPSGSITVVEIKVKLML